MDGQRRVAAHDGLARHPAGDRVAGRLATAPVGTGTARRKMSCNQIIQFSQQIRTFTKSLSEHPLAGSWSQCALKLRGYKYAGPDGPFGSGAHAGDGGAPVAVLVVAAEGAGLEGVGRSRSQAGHGHVAGVPTRSTRNSSRTPELSRVLSLPPAAAGDSRAPKNRCSVEPA